MTATAPTPSPSDRRSLRVVLAGNIVTANEERLRAKADFPVEITCLPDGAPDALREAALAHADAMVCIRLRHAPPAGSPLRLVQLQSAGYDGIDFARVPHGATVCNAFGHTNAIAEYVVMTMLMWTHRWKAVEESFRAGSWEYSGAMVGPLRDELAGKTVGILGYGQMGAAIAARARAMDTRVIACSRQAKPAADVDAFLPLERLDEFLGRCDFVVVCIAHVPETTGLIDARRLARMKRDAVLVNVARGPVVVEQDFYEALAGGTIAGAVIDVWWRYPDASDPRPRGSRFPFHELPNVLMTPHSSGWTEQMMDRRWDMIVENLRALWRGEPLRNVVRAAGT